MSSAHASRCCHGLLIISYVAPFLDLLSYYTLYHLRHPSVSPASPTFLLSPLCVHRYRLTSPWSSDYASLNSIRATESQRRHSTPSITHLKPSPTTIHHAAASLGKRCGRIFPRGITGDTPRRRATTIHNQGLTSYILPRPTGHPSTYTHSPTNLHT